MPLAVAPGVVIPDGELSFDFLRSSGPGGQNVNKVASAVQLRFRLAASAALAADAKARLRALAGRRVTAAGDLLITARSYRDRGQNRRDAEQRLVALVRRALTPPKPRRATRPSAAERVRRLEEKTHRQRTKRRRATPRWED